MSGIGRLGSDGSSVTGRGVLSREQSSTEKMGSSECLKVSIRACPAPYRRRISLLSLPSSVTS